MRSEPIPESFALQFDLPNPEQSELSSSEFLAKLENAWALCDRFDLQTEIWRGRILKVIRDREKYRGEGRGAGFLQWLREREISKTRAYGLIQLADSADDLVGEGLLKEQSVNLFSKRAFIETAQAAPEVKLMISEAANEGNEITRRQVRRLSDEFTSATSPLLPVEIRQKTQENLIPPRIVAPLVRELAKLPDIQQDEFRKALQKEPEIDCIKDVTSTARWIGKSLDASLAIKALQVGNLNLDKAMQEAQRLELMGILSDAIGQAQALESSVMKLHNAWNRLGGLHEKLWLESGSSTPYLREILLALQTLCGANIKVSLGEIAGGKKIRLQLVEEGADQLEPPKIS